MSGCCNNVFVASVTVANRLLLVLNQGQLPNVALYHVQLKYIRLVIKQVPLIHSLTDLFTHSRTHSLTPLLDTAASGSSDSSNAAEEATPWLCNVCTDGPQKLHLVRRQCQPNTQQQLQGKQLLKSTRTTAGERAHRDCRAKKAGSGVDCVHTHVEQGGAATLKCASDALVRALL